MSKIRFGDVLYIKGRIGWQALKKEEYLSKGDYYLVTGVDITDTHRINFDNCYFVSKERYEMDDKIQLRVGDIIVTKDGTIGKIGIIDKLDKPATLNSHLFLIRNEAPKVLDTDYLFQILRSQSFQKFASNNTSGSNIPAFTQANISKFEIDLPPLETQKRRAKILRTIDEKIINNTKFSSELEGLAKMIYDYWFLQFEFPNEEGKPYKSSGGKMVWNEELKREIPEGWKVMKFDDIVDDPPKLKAIKAPDYKDKGKYPIVDQADKLITGYTDDESYLYNNEECVVFGDVTTYFKYINFPFAKGTDGTKIIKSKENRIPALLLYHLVKDSKLPNVGFARHYMFLREVKILVPDKQVCRQYDHLTKNMMNKRRECIEENQQLTSLRDWLLPMLMNGQVTLKGTKNELG